MFLNILILKQIPTYNIHIESFTDTFKILSGMNWFYNVCFFILLSKDSFCNRKISWSLILLEVSSKKLDVVDPFF